MEVALCWHQGISFITIPSAPLMTSLHTVMILCHDLTPGGGIMPGGAPGIPGLPGIMPIGGGPETHSNSGQEASSQQHIAHQVWLDELRSLSNVSTN